MSQRLSKNSLHQLRSSGVWHRADADDDDTSSVESFNADELAELEEKTGRLAPDMVDSLLEEIASQQQDEEQRQVAQGLVKVVEQSLEEEKASAVGEDTLDQLAERFNDLLARGRDVDEGQTGVRQRTQASQTTEIIQLMDRREAKLDLGCSCMIETLKQLKGLMERLESHWKNFGGSLPSGGDAFLQKSRNLAAEMEGKTRRLVECTELHRTALLTQQLEYLPRAESLAEMTDFHKYLDLSDAADDSRDVPTR